MDVSFSEEARKEFEKKKYGIVGRHSAVQICDWTRKSLRGKGDCYKNKFYGAETHMCAQISPCAAWCSQSCIFCWRPMEWMGNSAIPPEEAEEPAGIIDGVVVQRRRLISGIGGAWDADRKRFDESFSKFPSHWAISLSGEPTLYSKLPALIKELKGKEEVKTIFLVSNGQEPEMFGRLAEEDALPTQLYISVSAPNAELFREINKPAYADGWERLNRSLGMLGGLDTRTVIRFTVIKGMNDSEEFLPAYGKMFEGSGADFIEVKAYMFLGYSRKRLKEENMPSHEEVGELCKKLLSFLPSYEKIDESVESRIVLLGRKKPRWPKRIL